MPYKNIENKRKLERERNRARRIEWFNKNGPCSCGSRERLELDHIDPETKIDHKIWSWSDQRRSEELAKCQVLCYNCHKEKSRKEKFREIPAHGTIARYKHKRFPCKCEYCKEANAKHEYIKRRTRTQVERELTANKPIASSILAESSKT